MKYLKIYEDFNNKEKELETMFSLVMGNTEVYKIPYSYYGTATKERRDFDIYVVSGIRNESNDHKLVQELYHNHKILNEVFNLEFFHIGLSKKYATVVLYDYVSSFDKNNKNHLSSIYTSKLPLPSNVKSRLKFTKTSSRLSVRPDGDYLNRGIDFSDGSSSNIALHDWIYQKPERYTNDDIIQANSISESNVFDQSVVDECKDILLELEDKGFNTNIRSYFSSGVSIGKEHNKNWIQFYLSRKEEFDYSDIEDVVERLKSYLSEFGLKIEWQNQAERSEQRPTIKTTSIMNPMTFEPEGIKTQCELHFN